MASEIYCTLDNFAASLEHILAKVDGEIATSVPAIIEEGAVKARKLVKKPAGWHQGVTAKKYKSGWQFTVSGSGREVNAEIGNARTPGLPHLLEFGHAQVGGGRTTAYEHVATAAEEAFEYTFDEIEKIVGKALL